MNMLETMVTTLTRKIPGYTDILRKHNIPVTDVKTKAELDELDAFNVLNGKENVELFRQYVEDSDELVREKEEITIVMPPLKEGIMKVSFNGNIEYIHWNVVDATESYYRVSIDCYTIRDNDANFQAAFVLSSDEIVDFLDTPHPETIYTILQKIDNRKYLKSTELQIIERFMPNLRDTDSYMVEMAVWSLKQWLVGMVLFDDLLNEEKQETLSLNGERVSVKCGFRKEREYKRRVIYLGGVKVECGRESNISVRKGQIVRKSDCWGVRGHYRHYQNGKVVYIAPYEKGENRNTGKKVNGKEYKVKECSSK